MVLVDHLLNIQKKLKYLDKQVTWSTYTPYSDSKDLAKRTISDDILKHTSYEITRNRGYDEYQRSLACMV